jgi:hypothetical protein
MASQELPELGFRQYSDEKIADEVLWPLVDHYWHTDWRQESAVGHSMHIEKRGIWKRGEVVDVSLAAFKQFADTEEEEELGMNTLSVVHLDIETIVADNRRELIRDLMQAEVDEVIAEIDDLDADDIEAIDDDELDDYYFKIHTGYTFDTDGYASVDSYRVIEDIDGDMCWHDEGDHIEKEPPNDEEMRRVMLGALPKAKLFSHDMSVLECGLYVLNAPEAIHKAFLRIRANPLRNPTVI